jgi:hypothetical protein
MKAYRVTIETGIKSTTSGVSPHVSEFSYLIYADDLDQAITMAYKNVEKLRRKEVDHFYTVTEVVEV